MPDGVDLLVFGPHPDDLEIGLGGAIAKHVALGHRVGLCDLTRGELGTTVSSGRFEPRGCQDLVMKKDPPGGQARWVEGRGS